MIYGRHEQDVSGEFSGEFSPRTTCCIIQNNKASAPDYTPVAEAQREASAEMAEIQREQLAWAKEQYAQDKAVVDRVVNTLLPTMQAEGQAGAETRERFKTVFQPLEDQFIQQARDFNTPERQEYEAGRASAEVGAALESQRRGALAALESYGVDPSMARSAALDAGLRVAGAAAQAGAANQARVNTEATGRAMLGEAINIGRGYPGQVASAYQTSQNAGQGAVSGQLAATQTGAGTMGTAAQWAGLRNQNLNSWGSQVASMNNAATAANASMTNSRNAIFADMFGTGVGALAGLSDPKTKKDMVKIGHDSESGLGIFSFRYKDAPARSPKVIGVNAAEVERKYPDAILRIPRKRGEPLRAVVYDKLPESIRRYIAPMHTPALEGAR